MAIAIEDEGDLVADCGSDRGWCECVATLCNLDCVDSADNESILSFSTVLGVRWDIRCRSEHGEGDSADDRGLHVERVT